VTRVASCPLFILKFKRERLHFSAQQKRQTTTQIFRAFDLYLKCLFLKHSYPFSSSSDADGVFFLFTMSSEIFEAKTWRIWTYSKRKRGQAKSSSPGCCSYWGSTPRSATGSSRSHSNSDSQTH